jgi:hypothetical protein
MVASGCAAGWCPELADGEFNNRLQVHRYPGFFPNTAYHDIDFAQRRFDRSCAVLVGDSRSAASHKSTTADRHPLIARWATIAAANHHRQQTLEQNIAVQW